MSQGEERWPLYQWNSYLPTIIYNSFGSAFFAAAALDGSRSSASYRRKPCVGVSIDI